MLPARQSIEILENQKQKREAEKELARNDRMSLNRLMEEVARTDPGLWQDESLNYLSDALESGRVVVDPRDKKHLDQVVQTRVGDREFVTVTGPFCKP